MQHVHEARDVEGGEDGEHARQVRGGDGVDLQALGDDVLVRDHDGFGEAGLILCRSVGCGEGCSSVPMSGGGRGVWDVRGSYGSRGEGEKAADVEVRLALRDGEVGDLFCLFLPHLDELLDRRVSAHFALKEEQVLIRNTGIPRRLYGHFLCAQVKGDQPSHFSKTQPPLSPCISQKTHH